MYHAQVLGDWLITGAQAAGTIVKPLARDGNSELDAHEVAEVVFLEIVPPVTGTGVIENIKRVSLILDDLRHPHISISGTDTSLMAPLRQNTIGNIVAFGIPLIKAARGGAPLLEGTCPKFSRNLRIEVLIGAGGTTADFRVRAWGYMYDTTVIQKIITPELGGEVVINEVRRQRVLKITKEAVALTKETWTQLPGGLSQAMPKINPLVRNATNAKATTVNIPYQMRFDTGDVATTEENMRFDFDRVPTSLLLKGLGVRAPANLKEIFLNIGGDDYPEKRIPATEFLNPVHFGKAYPIRPLSDPLYFPVPKLEVPSLITGEIGYAAIVDNGTAISANDVMVAINGVLIEDDTN